jgi:hypothetical protein
MPHRFPQLQGRADTRRGSRRGAHDRITRAARRVAESQRGCASRVGGVSGQRSHVMPKRPGPMCAGSASLGWGLGLPSPA